MLQQTTEQETQGYVSPIANLKVTPQEFSQALSAIEAKREVEGNGETIAIGDAIRQLGLNIDPQEVYAEIRRQQTPTYQASVPVSQTVERHHKSGKRFLVGFLLAGSLFFNFMLVMRFKQVRTVYPPTEMPVAELEAAPAMTMGETINASEVSGTRSGYARLDDIYELANGKKAESVKLSGNEFGMGDYNWKIVRLNDKLYVRGWTVPSGSFTQGDTQISDKTSFFASNCQGDMVQRTVPVSAFKNIKDPTYNINGTQGIQVPSEEIGK
jgi:hypothetical protein